HGGPDEPLPGNDVQETAEVGKLLAVRHRDVDAKDAARPDVHFGSRHASPGLGHVPLLEILGLGQRLPDEPGGGVDEPLDREIGFRIDRELIAHDSDSFSLSCLTYWSKRSSRASHTWRRAVSQSSATLNRSGAISYVRTRPRFFDFTSRLCS